MASTPTLKRSIGLPALILYGLGTMVGGGFFALLGKVVGEAGLRAPLALVIAGLLAFISAMSYAELSSRFPVSAGEARYVKEGLGKQSVATLVGILVIITGIVSAATLAVASIGFLRTFIDVPPRLGIFLLVLGMGMVAAWGVGQSVAVVVAISVVEVGALVYTFILGSSAFAELPHRWQEMAPNVSVNAWTGIFAAAFLAFYAFIGFEDLVNMAEEVKDVRHNLPIAILASVVLTTILYVMVALVGVLSVSPAKLAASSAPIAEIVSGHGWYSSTGLRIVSLLAGLNGALVQIVMASRVAYGLAKRGNAPGWLAMVNPKTRTPLRATSLMTLIVLALALSFGLTTLAKVTSGIILVVYAAVNFSLWQLKRRHPPVSTEGPSFPDWVPLTGAIACTAVLLFQGWLLTFGR